MKQALIQTNNQAAVLRNRQAWLDVLAITRTLEEARLADEQSTTKLWWATTPNVNDDRVVIWIEQAADNPLLLPEEVSALITEEQAIADGFYFPDPFKAPVNTVSPSLTFTTASPGKAVSCIAGTWTGDPAPTFKWQWQADGVDINQAITSTHTVTLADVGKVLTCVVTATNTNGSASAVSNECNAIALVARTAAKKTPAKKTPAKKK